MTNKQVVFILIRKLMAIIFLTTEAVVVYQIVFHIELYRGFADPGPIRSMMIWLNDQGDLGGMAIAAITLIFVFVVVVGTMASLGEIGFLGD